MNKRKPGGWIVGLLNGERKYQVGNVTYVVSAQYAPSQSAHSIRSRMEAVLRSDLTDLKEYIPADTMTEEYAYSAAGKED